MRQSVVAEDEMGVRFHAGGDTEFGERRIDEQRAAEFVERSEKDNRASLVGGRIGEDERTRAFELAGKHEIVSGAVNVVGFSFDGERPRTGPVRRGDNRAAAEDNRHQADAAGGVDRPGVDFEPSAVGDFDSSVVACLAAHPAALVERIVGDAFDAHIAAIDGEQLFAFGVVVDEQQRFRRQQLSVRPDPNAAGTGPVAHHDAGDMIVLEIVVDAFVRSLAEHIERAVDIEREVAIAVGGIEHLDGIDGDGRIGRNGNRALRTAEIGTFGEGRVGQDAIYLFVVEVDRRKVAVGQRHEGEFGGERGDVCGGEHRIVSAHLANGHAVGDGASAQRHFAAVGRTDRTETEAVLEIQVARERAGVASVDIEVDLLGTAADRIEVIAVAGVGNVVGIVDNARVVGARRFKADFAALAAHEQELA